MVSPSRAERAWIYPCSSTDTLVSIRGTVTDHKNDPATFLQNVVTNTSIQQDDWVSLDTSGCPGKVHSGFQKACRAIIDPLTKVIWRIANQPMPRTLLAVQRSFAWGCSSNFARSWASR